MLRADRGRERAAGEAMKVIHVLRKPCSEPTVAANVLKHGTGALNIDGCRINAPDTAGKVWVRGGNQTGASLTTNTTGLHQYIMANPAGRWPANLVLQHLDGCVQEGVKKVKPGNGSGRTSAGAHGFRTAYIGGERKGAGFTGSFVGDDGTETVAAWTCAPGCPVAALDQQSGILSPQGSPKRVDTQDSSFLGTGFGGGATTFYGDIGGASRFFKQLKP